MEWLISLAGLLVRFFRNSFPVYQKVIRPMDQLLLNISANMLGLDNAATPVGLKAMKEMQEVNPDKETASDAQIMFLVLNAAGLTIIPVSIIVYRTQLGAVNPADIFIPILDFNLFCLVNRYDKCCNHSENKSFR